MAEDELRDYLTRMSPEDREWLELDLAELDEDEDEDEDEEEVPPPEKGAPLNGDTPQQE